MAERWLPFAGSRHPTAGIRRQHQPRVRGVVTRDGDALIIRFSAMSAPHVNAVKEIRGWRWIPPPSAKLVGHWTVHIGHVRQVRAAATKHGWTLSPAVVALPDVDTSDFPMLVSVEGEQLVIDGPWREDVAELLTDADGRLEERSGKWRVPLEHCVDVVLDLRAVAKVRFVGDANEITDRIDHATYMLTLSRQLEPTDGWMVAPTIARSLKTFQNSGVEYGWRSTRSFNWATVGAGKTTLGLCVMEQLDWTTTGEGREWALEFLRSTQRPGAPINEPTTSSPFPLLIIAPAGLKTNWVREIKAVLPHRTTHICEGRTPVMPLIRPDVWISNYDILGKVDERSWSAAFIQEIALGKIGSVITDEGHRCGVGTTQRSVAAVAIAAALPPTAPRMLMTGTPVRNGRRQELVAQLQVIGRGDEFGTVAQLKKDLRLSRRLRATCAWRPNQGAVLKALGVLKADGTAEAVWQTVVVDGDPKILAEYRRAETNFLDVIRDKARAKAAQMGVDPESAAVEAAMRAEAAASLIQVNLLCRLAGQAKIKAAKEWVADFESTGEKLLVFAENIDMMDAISAGRIPQIRGGVPQAVRTKLVDRFQEESWIAKNDYVQTLVLQTVAAGEGITLTKAYQHLYAQMTWSPGAMDQCAGRGLFRMNDPHGVICHVLVCADTIDEDRMLVLNAKREAMRLVTDGDQMAAAAGESTFGDVFARLLKRSLGITDDKPKP